MKQLVRVAAGWTTSTAPMDVRMDGCKTKVQGSLVSGARSRNGGSAHDAQLLIRCAQNGQAGVITSGTA